MTARRPSRLRWLVLLPSVAPQGAATTGSPPGGLLGPSHWISIRDARSQRAPGSHTLRLETLATGGGEAPDPAFWLENRGLLPKQIEVRRRDATGQPASEVVLGGHEPRGSWGDLVIGRITSGFDVSALFLECDIDDVRLERLQSIGLETAVRDIIVRTRDGEEAMTEWALRVMLHVLGPPLDSTMTPQAEVHLEVILQGAERVDVPDAAEVAEHRLLTTSWNPWGLIIAEREEHPRDDRSGETGELIRDLQEVHALARIQQWHLLELSAAVSTGRIRPSSNALAPPRGRRQVREARIALAEEDARLRDHLEGLRLRYLKLLQSGIFSYVNRIPLAQEVYDGVRDQVRLGRTHDEVRLELDLLASHVETRLRQRGLDQDRAFQTRIKIYGSLIAVAAMFAGLFQLLTEDARAWGCGLLTSDEPAPFLGWLDGVLCAGGASSAAALLLGGLAYLSVKILSRRP